MTTFMTTSRRFSTAWMVVIMIFAVSQDSLADEGEQSTVREPAVPPGARWWCFNNFDEQSSASISRCFRSRNACRTMASIPLKGARPPKCFVADRAAAVSHLNVVQETLSSTAFLTIDECLRYRRDLKPSDVRDVSACRSVGATTGVAFQPAMVTEGRGWFCLRHTSTPGAVTVGIQTSSCRRTKSLCAALEKEARQSDDERVTGACRPQKEAWVSTGSDTYLVFASEQTCIDGIASQADTSVCTKVR